MKTVIIVSKCTKVRVKNDTESWYEFHFKGVFSGESLRRLVLIGKHDFGLKKEVEYLMYVQMIELDRGILKGKILKVKPLDECWDRS